MNLNAETDDNLQNGKKKDPVLTGRIVEAAFQLFSQYGIKSVSMDDVAQTTGISKRTLYEFFEDKEELLVAVIRFHRKLMLEIIAEVGKGSGTILDAILGFYKHMANRSNRFSPKFHDDVKKYPKALKELHDGREIFFRDTHDVLLRGIDQGVFTESVNLEIIALLMREQVDMNIPQRMFRKFTQEQVYSTIMFTLLRGICTEKGIALCDEFLRQQEITGKR